MARKDWGEQSLLLHEDHPFFQYEMDTSILIYGMTIITHTAWLCQVKLQTKAPRIRIGAGKHQILHGNDQVDMLDILLKIRGFVEDE